MEIKTFIVENGKVDSNGDMLMIDGLKMPDKKVPLLYNFDNSRLITKIDVFKEDGVVKAKGEIPDEYLNLYPALGFQVIEAKANEHGKIITQAKLYCVGLSEMPNTDETIKRISDQ